METIYTDDPIKGKVKAGIYDREAELFIKVVERKKHHFNLVNGYAIQLDTYNRLKKRGVKHIVIDEQDTGNQYHTAIEDWEDKGGIWTGRSGKQRTLSERYFTLMR